MLSALEGSLAEYLSSFEYTQVNNWQGESADSKTAQQMLESTLTVALRRIHFKTTNQTNKKPKPQIAPSLSKRCNWLSLKQPVVSLIILFNQT